MLTDEEIAEMQQMRNDGYTLKEIAEKYHVTISTVGYNTRGKTRNLARNRVDAYIYPNISKWLVDNNLSICNAAKMMDINNCTLNSLLLGTRTNPTKFVIDAILKATGLTYEQAFREE